MVMTADEVMQLAQKNIDTMPKNAIKTYLPAAQAMLHAGRKWPEITAFFNDEVGIKIKQSALKNAYYEAYPGEQKGGKKGKGKNKDNNSQQNNQ